MQSWNERTLTIYITENKANQSFPLKAYISSINFVVYGHDYEKLPVCPGCVHICHHYITLYMIDVRTNWDLIAYDPSTEKRSMEHSQQKALWSKLNFLKTSYILHIVITLVTVQYYPTNSNLESHSNSIRKTFYDLLCRIKTIKNADI